MKEKADSIFYSEKIYTGTKDLKSWTYLSGGVAVKDGKIIAIGEKKEVSQYCGPQTQKVDFGDKILLPSFIDGHTHMMSYVPKVDLSTACSIEECKQLIKQFYDLHKNASIIMGEKWYAPNWGGKLPSKECVDEIIQDIPFFATDLDLHRVWCNSVLLKQIGLTKKNFREMTSGRESMVIVDEKQEPTGILIDELAMEVLNTYKVKDTEENVAAMYDIWTKYGVTAINAMDFYLPDNDIFKITKQMEEKGTLNVRVFASLDASKADKTSISDAKKFMNTSMFRLNALKAFMDGTGAGYTAYMKSPYVETKKYGNQYMSEEELLQYILLANEEGLGMHTHCCGDAAIATALKVYQRAVDCGVRMDERFSIEHCDTTAEEELEIPAQLGISLNLTPDFMAPTQYFRDNPYLKVYDEDVQKELWRIKSFIDTGVNVSFGTDYTASSMNPFDQIYRATQRVANDGKPEGGFHPEEKISVEQAIYCYTMGSAKSIGMGEKLGTLVPGKYADMMVLDRDIFFCTPIELKNTTILSTIVDGRMVYIQEDKI